MERPGSRDTGLPSRYAERPLARPDEDIFDQGLAFDLETLFDRRRALKVMGFAGAGVHTRPTERTVPTS